MDKKELAKKWNPRRNDLNVSNFVKKRVGELLEMDLDLLIDATIERCIENTLTELNKWVYNDENQAGVKLQIVDASDFPEIMEAIRDKIK